MKTSELEMHIKRVIWRYGIAIKRVARMHKDIDSEAARKIVDGCYVDDITTGFSEKEVIKMIVVPFKEDDRFETKGTLIQILSHGSFRFKAIVCSGERDS